MSLIPYQPREGREIVLRHQNAIVVRDSSSQRLEIQRVECPTCHQPLAHAIPHEQSNFVKADYFQMLRIRGRSTEQPPSPIRRLTQPPFGRDPDEPPDGDLESNSAAQSEHSRIHRDAFSPNYFATFFIEERELGRGGKGVVMLVRHQIDGCHLGHFACKRVPVGDDHAWLEKVMVEVTFLAKLSHPNLVSYRHVWLEDVQLTRFGPPVACAFILQQYCNGGDLLHYIVGNQQRQATKEDLKAHARRRSKGQSDAPVGLAGPSRRLPFEELFSLFKDITSGLAYLHGANYVHRDLKPSNCLLHREGNTVTCLISDFGEVQAEDAVRKSTGSTGTISYCAPEVLKQDSRGVYGNFTTKSDIFSLGMILYFLCFHRLPYQSANVVQEELEDVDQLRAEIVDWQGFKYERRERPDLPSKLFHLLQKLLALNPTERPSAAEVLHAMNPDSSIYDGFSRPKPNGSPVLALSVLQRIQSWDSPAPPNTPPPDLSLPPRRRSAKEGENFDSPSLRERPSVGKMVHAAADLRDNLDQDSVSPTNTQYAAVPSSGQQQHQPDIEMMATPVILPPLLMAPPSTWSSEISRLVGLGWFHVSHFFAAEGESLLSSVRLGLFVLKIITLWQPCYPLTARLSVSLPLLFVAGVDLSRRATGYMSGSHGRMLWVLSAVLMGLHLATIHLADRWDALCAVNVGGRWEG